MLITEEVASKIQQKEMWKLLYCLREKMEILCLEFHYVNYQQVSSGFHTSSL